MAPRPPFPFDLPLSLVSDLRSLASSASQLVGRLDTADSKLDRLLDVITPLGDELEKMRSVAVGHQAQMTRNEQQLGAVESQFASTERQMTTLEREIGGLQLIVSGLQDDLHHILDRVPGLKPPEER